MATEVVRLKASLVPADQGFASIVLDGLVMARDAFVCAERAVPIRRHEVFLPDAPIVRAHPSSFETARVRVAHEAS